MVVVVGAGGGQDSNDAAAKHSEHLRHMLKECDCLFETAGESRREKLKYRHGRRGKNKTKKRVSSSFTRDLWTFRPLLLSSRRGGAAPRPRGKRFGIQGEAERERQKGRAGLETSGCCQERRKQAAGESRGGSAGLLGGGRVCTIPSPPECLARPPGTSVPLVLRLLRLNHLVSDVPSSR